MTKCGRYGRDVASFDYSPARVRASVLLSLDRLQTSYLDTVYLHDVEFVCTGISPWIGGNSVDALTDDLRHFGLAEGEEGKVREEEEQAILEAIAELRRLQDEGLIKNVGISGENNARPIPESVFHLRIGYPLPTLLRIALLVLHTPPYKPLDIVLSYCHLTLQNTVFKTFAPQFRGRAQVGKLVTASPLSMALLTPNPPAWHPAPTGLLKAVSLAQMSHAEWPGGLPNLALGYSIRNARLEDCRVPVAVGLSSPREVHECMRVWREISGHDDEGRRAREEEVRKVIDESGFLDWSWPSP
jgi:D-arabinose 1-dehydrogenase